MQYQYSITVSALLNLIREQQGSDNGDQLWTLLVRSIDRADAGEYSCTASNRHGQDSLTVTLLVLGEGGQR